METIIKTIDVNTSEQEREEIINQAGTIIKNSGLVAFPTETVYGLGANALDEEAAEKIYAAKGRPSDNPLIIHIAKIKDLEVVVSDIPEAAIRLAEKFWPGPLTMVLNKTPLVPLTTTGGLETVAVRMPENHVAKEIIEAAGGFVAAPSANSSGRPSPTLAEHVIEDMMGKIDMIVDAGSCSLGLESTIIDLTSAQPVILRPGLITAGQLEQVIGKIEYSQEEDNGLEEDDRPKAPGMKYRHYAPNAELSIFVGRAENVANKINFMTDDCIKNGKQVGIICSEETKEMYHQGNIEVIGSLADFKNIAAHLYKILRGFDAKGVDYIFSESFFGGEVGEAIMNRLNKAAGGKVFICSVDIDYSRIKNLAFVDDNDVCLAPMAAAIFSNIKNNDNIDVSSAGLKVLFAEPINPKVEVVLRENNINIKEHKAKRADKKYLKNKTIVALSAKVKSRILDEYDNLENVYTLSELIDEMVVLNEPFGKDLDEYNACYDEMLKALNRLKELITR